MKIEFYFIYFNWRPSEKKWQKKISLLSILCYCELNSSSNYIHEYFFKLKFNEWRWIKVFKFNYMKIEHWIYFWKLRESTFLISRFPNPLFYNQLIKLSINKLDQRAQNFRWAFLCLFALIIVIFWILLTYLWGRSLYEVRDFVTK